MADSKQQSLVKDLIESGIHFGQRTSNWNPKMAPFIYGKRNSIHIIDIRETIKHLLLAKRLIAQTVGNGKDVCFVGTKRQAKEVLERRVPDVGMHYVTERWLGGTLTNFRTIRARLKRLEELEAIEADDNFQSYSKKMESQLRREMRKIKRNLDGIRRMEKLPGVIVVIDTRRENNALLEAKKLGIPTICLIDTDGDPEHADIPIPGNDDSMRSIDVIIRELTNAVVDGKQQRTTKSGDREDESGDKSRQGDAQGATRRSRRSQFRADEETPAPEGENQEAGAAAQSSPSAG
jgi:small subunit ribosomal protein S2